MVVVSLLQNIPFVKCKLGVTRRVSKELMYCNLRVKQDGGMVILQFSEEFMFITTLI